MQTISNIQKIIFFAVLPCYLLVVLLSGKMVFTGPRLLDPDTLLASSSSSIWSNMSRELNLDHQTQSSQVQAEIHKLLSDKDKLYDILQAAGPYIYFIHEEIQERGLPAELALIPVIESEFNPNDHSRKGAIGLWQLMRGTARDLGVPIQSGYDGRRNVVDSTKAALSYFNDLGNNFKGNWYLAIAAYNCGQMKIESAERRAGTDSFWNLPLPRETRIYVPKLLALAAIIKDPEKYGVELPPITNQPYFTELKTKKSVNLTQLAKQSGVSIETLKALNPDYHSGSVQPTKKGSHYYHILVPVTHTSVVKAQLADNIISS